MAENASHRSIFLSIYPALLHGRAVQRQGKSIEIGHLIHALGPTGLPLLVFLMAAPFIWPLSLGPLTAPSSAVIMLIAYALIRGQNQFPIPAKYLAAPIPNWAFRFIRRVIAFMVRRLKLRSFASKKEAYSPLMAKWCAYGIVVAAFLLAVPIPVLPLTNTFPAMGIMAFVLGYVGGSRSRFMLGVGLCIFSTLIFAVIGVVVLYAGREALTRIFGSE